MKKIVLALCCFICACQYKDHNKNIVKPPKPAAIDTSVVIKGNAAGLVDQYMNRQVNDSAFSGAVFITRNDTLLLCKGYGITDSTDMTAFTPNTLVPIDAFEEYLVTSAILNLYHKGKLKPSDVFSTWFSKAPSHQKNITLHQLLTHSSGFNDTVQQDTLHTICEQVFSQHLAFKPGTQAAYSKTNTVLLKAIVEMISGTSFDQYLQKTMGLPLKIKTEPIPERIPSFNGHQLANGISTSATAKNLFNWMLCFTEGKILPDSLVQKMYTPYFPVKGSAGVFSYGYGCRISLTRSLLKMVNWGQNNAGIIYYPEEKLMIGIIGHYPNFKVDGILPNLVQLFFDGYISTNAGESLHGFETKGARVLYTLIVEKGENYFTAHALETLTHENLPENEMFFLEAGQKLISEKKWTAAQTVYLLLTERFSQNVVAWNDLAEIYMARNEKSKARKCLENSLKINPGNERAKKLMEKMD